MLVSRDEQSCLVVSYASIKACTEQAFRYVEVNRVLSLDADRSHARLQRTLFGTSLGACACHGLRPVYKSDTICIVLLVVFWARLYL